jgi:hypothetical protein
MAYTRARDVQVPRQFRFRNKHPTKLPKRGFLIPGYRARARPRDPRPACEPTQDPKEFQWLSALRDRLSYPGRLVCIAIRIFAGNSSRTCSRHEGQAQAPTFLNRQSEPSCVRAVMPLGDLAAISRNYGHQNSRETPPGRATGGGVSTFGPPWGREDQRSRRMLLFDLSAKWRAVCQGPDSRRKLANRDDAGAGSAALVPVETVPISRSWDGLALIRR